MAAINYKFRIQGVSHLFSAPKKSAPLRGGAQRCQWPPLYRGGPWGARWRNEDRLPAYPASPTWNYPPLPSPSDDAAFAPSFSVSSLGVWGGGGRRQAAVRHLGGSVKFPDN